MQKVITIPGYGEVEFPDTMSEDDVNKAAAKLYKDGGASKVSASRDPQFADVQGGSSAVNQPITPKPWYQEFFDTAQQGARNVLGGIPTAITGIPGALAEAGSGITDSVSSPEKFIKSMATGGPLMPMAVNTVKGIAQPAITSAKGLGAIAGLNEAPTDEEFAQAQSGAGGILGGLLLPKVTAAAAPKAGNLFNKLKGALPENFPPAEVNKWIGITEKDLRHGARPAETLISEKLLGPTKEATLANVEPALQDAGRNLGVKLRAADRTGITMNGDQIMQQEINKAQKSPIGTDAAFIKRLNDIYTNAINQFPNLDHLSPSQAHEFKQWIGSATKFDGSNTPYASEVNVPMQGIYGEVNDWIKTKVPGAAADQARWQSLYKSSEALQKQIRSDAAGVGTGKKPPTKIRKAAKTLGKAAAIGAAGTLAGGLAYEAIKD